MASVKGDPQNSGNLLPSRPSTRLHAPPGGQSSLSLAWGPQEPPQQQPQQSAPAVVVPKKDVEPPTTTTAAAEKGGLSSNAFANGANQNCGNVLTDRPTTRLHAPPGGKSTISLG
mmetsp:Transcript_720/g.2481  ORF Transcript_720/g.2481 Transcript_720/m.2481 type:complete len:115 (-) Transcript_720:213-557(-)